MSLLMNPNDVRVCESCSARGPLGMIHRTGTRSFGDRLSEAWGLVLDNLSDAEAAKLLLIYTNTPEENAQAELDAAAEREAG